MVLVAGLGLGGVLAQVSVQDQIEEAFNAISEASGLGGDVSELVAILNTVILEVDSGEYNSAEVSAKVTGIIVEAEDLTDSAVSENNLGLVITGANIVVVIVLGYLVWRYFPTLYWRTWLRVRGGWVVE